MSNERLTSALGEVCNSLGLLNSKDHVRKLFSTQHRTIQQQFMKVVIVPILQHLAKAHEEGRVDLRNQAAAALAAKMLENVTEDDLYLPFI